MVEVDLRKHLDHQVIRQCMRFLEEKGGTDISLGKRFIENSDIYVNVSEYTTHQLEVSGWEAHKKYADLQVLLFLEDGHMPSVCIERQPMKVKKAVFKIPMHHFV